MTLIPFPVFSEKLRPEPWWSSAATARLILLEYLKFVFSHVRMRVNPERRRIRLSDCATLATARACRVVSTSDNAAAPRRACAQQDLLVLVILRSAVFNVLFYLNLLVHFVVAIPTLVMPRMAIVKVAMFWGRTNNWLLRVVCGIKVEYRGLEKIPPGALLVASKHQSLWETFALLWLFSDPAFILKRELQWIPFFGWYAMEGRA